MVARALNILMAPTLTNASEYSPIEAHFRELKDPRLTASVLPSKRHLAAAVHLVIEYRNWKASPKVQKVKRRLWARH